MKSENKYRYLLKNTMLFTMANILNKLIVFILLPFYTAFLTTEEYAVIDLITVTQQLIFPVITLDITEAVIRFGMEKNSDKSVIFQIGLFFTAAGNGLLVLAACAAIGLNIWARQYIIYFVLFFLSVSWYTFFSSFLRTVDKIKVITVASVANTCAATGLNIWLVAEKGMGMTGYFGGYIAGNLVGTVIMMWGIRSEQYLRHANRDAFGAYCIPMIKYAVPMIPNAVFWWINSSLDRYFLSALGTLSSVGMYAAANKIPSILNTVTSVFLQSWSLSLFRESDTKSRKAFFSEVFSIYHLFNLSVSLCLILGVKLICGILLSREFFTAWRFVPWLIIGFYSNSISSFAGTEFTAAKKTSWIILTTLVSAVVNTVLNILLIPTYGGAGAAIATCISCFILCELRIVLLKRFFAIEINNRNVWLTHLGLAVLAGCIGRI